MSVHACSGCYLRVVRKRCQTSPTGIPWDCTVMQHCHTVHSPLRWWISTHYTINLSIPTLGVFFYELQAAKIGDIVIFWRKYFFFALNSIPYELSNRKTIVRYLHGECVKSRPKYGYVSISYWSKKVELNISTQDTRHVT